MYAIRCFELVVLDTRSVRSPVPPKLVGLLRLPSTRREAARLVKIMEKYILTSILCPNTGVSSLLLSDANLLS